MNDLSKQDTFAGEERGQHIPVCGSAATFAPPHKLHQICHAPSVPDPVAFWFFVRVSDH